ncbi:MAG: calcium/sodium antiporter [Chloroflexota bacterium]
MISQLLVLIVSIVVLWLGAVWIVESAARLARRLGLSDLVIGLTVVAIGTSLPELAVSADAAFEGSPDIALGNVIGSNIFNVGIILGGVALVRGINMSRQIVYRDGFILLVSAILLAVFLSDLHLARWEGGILLAMIAGYLLYLGISREMPDEETPAGEFSRMDIPRLVGGLIVVLAGAHFLVESASTIARSFGVSEWLIGVTIVALGTSTPEIATSAAGLVRGLHNVSAGNLIGSDLFNILGALGLAAVIAPFTVGAVAQQSLPLMIGMVLALLIMMRSGWQLSRWEGGLLVLLGLARWGINVGGW